MHRTRKSVPLGPLQLILLCTVLVACCAPAYTFPAPEQTNDGWQTASLDEVGIDAEELVEAVERIQDGTYQNVHSILIVKDGKLAFEELFVLLFHVSFTFCAVYGLAVGGVLFRLIARVVCECYLTQSASASGRRNGNYAGNRETRDSGSGIRGVGIAFFSGPEPQIPTPDNVSPKNHRGYGNHFNAGCPVLPARGDFLNWP